MTTPEILAGHVTVARFCYLTPHQVRRLDIACAPIRTAFDTPYLVGSCLERADYRDVDVRVLLVDKRFDRLFGKRSADPVDGAAHGSHAWRYVCMAISGELSRATGLNIDFQFQRRTEANAASVGRPRNTLGLRLP